ncbi:hypothetical protein ACFL0Z_02305 [Patescibacteria group bacterium]
MTLKEVIDMDEEGKTVKVHQADNMSSDDCDAEITEALAQLTNIAGKRKQMPPTKKGITPEEQTNVLARFQQKMKGSEN